MQNLKKIQTAEGQCLQSSLRHQAEDDHSVLYTTTSYAESKNNKQDLM